MNTWVRSEHHLLLSPKALNRDHPVEPTQFCCWDRLQTTNDVGPIPYWWVVEPTHLKNMLVKLDHFRQIGLKIKNI